jgi:hypothetical protein
VYRCRQEGSCCCHNLIDSTIESQLCWQVIMVMDGYLLVRSCISLKLPCVMFSCDTKSIGSNTLLHIRPVLTSFLLTIFLLWHQPNLDQLKKTYSGRMCST